MIQKKIILITGGERSGKSTYAEQLALKLNPTPTYVATARIWDEEFRERVARHQQRRGKEWTNIEEDLHLSKLYLNNQVVLIDCLTLWSTNFFFDMKDEKVDAILDAIKEEIIQLTKQDAVFIFVTNEIGMGGVPIDPVQRRFTDLLGWVNQFVASLADEVILMVSGIPVKIK